MTIMANEIKTKGVSIFDTLFETFSEVIINVRGKNKYCVIPFDEYEGYRAYKLDMAHKEVMENIDKGKYHTDINKHFDTIKEAISEV
ncbi:MAG: prevent-host-death protein [Campylobacterota bacterium]|nr:prevent-host-death protein [Campylobacterota bacterium]